jgi:hypothetical protein
VKLKNIVLIIILLIICAATLLAVNRNMNYCLGKRLLASYESVVTILGAPSVKGIVQDSAKNINLKITSKVISGSEVGLKRNMRALWESRATLLRGYIICAINDSNDLLEAKNRLLNNASDLGASIKPYYGYFAGGILTGFLKKDVELTEKFIKRSKTGNKKDIDWTRKELHSNASMLAGFFAIPKNQTIEELKGMLYKHLDLTIGEIEAILNKDGTNDLDYYEKDRTHMLMFSDVLTAGIVRQFPDKFKE